MRSGQLRHFVTIQSIPTTKSASGADIPGSPVTFAQVWAAIEPLKGREYLDSARVNADVSHRIRIRYLAGVTPEMQVAFGSRTFKIQAVLNIDERSREMHLMVLEQL